MVNQTITSDYTSAPPHNTTTWQPTTVEASINMGMVLGVSIPMALISICSLFVVFFIKYRKHRRKKHLEKSLEPFYGFDNSESEAECNNVLTYYPDYFENEESNMFASTTEILATSSPDFNSIDSSPDLHRKDSDKNYTPQHFQTSPVENQL